MSNEKALTVVQQKEVAFYDDQITAVRTTDGTVYVPIRPICDLMGVTFTGQRERINRDPILSEIAMRVSVTLSHIDPSSRSRRTQDMIALPLEYLNGWLFGINANRVKAGIKDRVLQYQRDCYRILADAFVLDRITHRPIVDIEEYLQESDAPTAVAYRHAMAIANLAREQALLRLDYDNLHEQVGDNTTRLDAIEAQLGSSDRYVTERQASQISQAVKTVANELSQQTGGNAYGGVYGELYRRFEITSYKRLPAAQFEEAMSFLRQWYQSLVDGGEAPF